ncbi:unnamed protein product [Cuscuta europaea]|uniref:Uncharacterized protein n=1 Tax=Cuscuta europaea TaxID=41803 RepID=A0A9P0Z8Q8_CUSEU|nr:unnamed protein product [Cuscuta europaea]
MAKPNGIIYSSPKPPQPLLLYANTQDFGHIKQSFWQAYRKPNIATQGTSVLCHCTETRHAEREESIRQYLDCSDSSNMQGEDKHPALSGRCVTASQGLAEACKFVYNDAKFVNERAKNDIILISRGIMRLDARARQDVAFLGSEFLKLDARAREDTEKIDHDVKRKAERLHHVAIILKNTAESRLKNAADLHWSNGALEADLRHADFVAKQRAMEDAFMAVKFVKNIHDMMVNKMCNLNMCSLNAAMMTQHITLEKNRKSLTFPHGEMSAERITAVQEAYWDIAFALSEADGIDYTDPEELELLVSTLIDLDAMDGKSTVSLLAECSSSSDVNTRKALANALSAAPSMWTLGNAGMGALQRLSEDSNPAIAAAASKTIKELERQWEIEEGDCWRFMVKDNSQHDDDDDAGI